MRVDVVDPSAYTPPYDHALCAALARAGARVRLVTSAFAHGAVPRAEGYEVSLVLEATIGFNKTGSREATEVSTFDFRVDKSEPAPLKMTPLDKKFLRSLKISVEEEED